MLIAVADGIGGHAAGGLASAAVVERLASETFDDPSEVDRVLRSVDAELLERGTSTHEFRLGTTFCGILLGSRPAALVVGDGLAACRSAGALRTFGPTWNAVAANMRIDTAIGGRESHEPLVLAWCETFAEPGMRYIVASDGLVRAMPEAACREALGESATPEACIARLFTEARMGIMPDNMTCIVADLFVDES